MKPLDYLYVNLYNFYYKDGKSNISDNPSIRAAHILSFMFLLWIISFILLFGVYCLHKSDMPNMWLWIVMYLVLYTPIYYFYCTKKRYEIIYETYKNLPIKRKKTGVYIVLSLVVMPLLLIFFICIIH